MKILTPRDQVIALYRSGMTQRQVGGLLGIGQQAVCRILRHAGVVCRVTSRIHNWTFPCEPAAQPELAYWMGFSFADGCAEVSGSNERLVIRIHHADRVLLERLVEFVGATPSMIRSVNVSQKGVKSVRASAVGVWFIKKGLLAFLKPWGVVPRKSYAENFVRPDISDYLLPHFIRGWFDGDGYVRTNAAGVGIVATIPAAEYLAVSLRLFGVDSVFERRKTPPTMADVRLLLEQTERFYRLCNGRPRLERKWSQLDKRFAAA